VRTLLGTQSLEFASWNQELHSFASKRTLVHLAANGSNDEGFSMRATARGFGAGLTLARVDKPLKEEAVGC